MTPWRVSRDTDQLAGTVLALVYVAPFFADRAGTYPFRKAPAGLNSGKRERRLACLLLLCLTLCCLLLALQMNRKEE